MTGKVKGLSMMGNRAVAPHDVLALVLEGESSVCNGSVCLRILCRRWMVEGGGFMMI